MIGGTLHPVGGPDIADGTLVISAAKISAIGGPELSVPPSARTVDVHGSFEQALTIVYRMLFLLFAEARALVPLWIVTACEARRRNTGLTTPTPA